MTSPLKTGFQCGRPLQHKLAEGWLVSPAAEEALALQSRGGVHRADPARALASVGGSMDGVAPAYDELLCDCHNR